MQQLTKSSHIHPSNLSEGASASVDGRFHLGLEVANASGAGEEAHLGDVERQRNAARCQLLLLPQVRSGEQGGG